MRNFTLNTTYHDYEAHGNTPRTYKVRLRIKANNYRHAVIKANGLIRRRNSEFNKYDFIPLPIHKEVI